MRDAVLSHRLQHPIYECSEANTIPFRLWERQQWHRLLMLAVHTKNSFVRRKWRERIQIADMVVWACVRFSQCLHSQRPARYGDRTRERVRDRMAERMNQHMRQIAEVNIICVFLLASTLVTFDCKPISNFVFSAVRAFLTWDFGVIDLRSNKHWEASTSTHTHTRARNHTSSTSLHLSRSMDPDIDHRFTFSFSQQIKSLLARSLARFIPHTPFSTSTITVSMHIVRSGAGAPFELADLLNKPKDLRCIRCVLSLPTRSCSMHAACACACVPSVWLCATLSHSHSNHISVFCSLRFWLVYLLPSVLVGGQLFRV